MSNKTSYQYLSDMSKISSFSSFSKRVEPRTPRTDYIIEQLKLLEVDYQEDEFFPHNDSDYKYINIYVKFQSKNTEEKETILFVSHHDIANPYSQNAQDNTSSVCNLLEFCSILKTKELNKNVIVCFTDGEELANYASGAARIANQSLKKESIFENVLYAINLELTGRGKNIWADFEIAVSQFKNSKLLHIVAKKIPNVLSVGTPYNDSYALRRFGLDSICIGCFTDEDVYSYNNREYPPTWILCHKSEDTFDKIIEDDMIYFVNEVLVKFIE